MPRKSLHAAANLSRRAALAGLSAGALGAALASRGAAFVQDATPVATELDVAYGKANGAPLVLDIYRPPGRARVRPWC